MKAFGESMGRFSNAERYARCNFGIPFSPYITEEEQDQVVSAVLSAFRTRLAEGDPMKYALIGCGRIAVNHIKPR